MMNPSTDKLVRRTTMVATVVASYLLLTSDSYGPEPNALTPIKNAIQSVERSVKDFVFGPKKGNEKAEKDKTASNPEKEH